MIYMNRQGGLIIAVLLLFVSVATGLAVFFLYPRVKTSPVMTVVTKETPELSVSKGVVISARVLAPEEGKSKVEITLRPESEITVPLIAFSLGANIVVENWVPVSESQVQFLPNPALTEAGWNFPIANLSEDSEGKWYIELSGFVLGNPYQLSQEVSLGSIEIPAVLSSGLVRVQPNSETEFIGEKREEIPFKAF